MQGFIFWLTKSKGGEGQGEAQKLKYSETFHFKLAQK